MLNAQKSTELSKQQGPDSGQAQRGKHSGTRLLLSSHSVSFITAQNDILDRASSVFMKGSAHWGSVRVRMFTANRTKIPIYDSQKKPSQVNGKSPSCHEVHLYFSNSKINKAPNLKWVWSHKQPFHGDLTSRRKIKICSLSVKWRMWDVLYAMPDCP